MKDNIRINVIVNMVRTLVLTILSFITFPWVCRHLGESALGTYAWATTFVAYFLILAKIGIPNLAIRECVKVRDNKELLSNRAQAFFILQLISTVLSFALMAALVFSIPSLKSESSVIFILSLNFLTGAFSFEWIFIALEKQFYMSVRSIVALTLSAILIICFVTTPSDILIYALIAISVTICTTIANLYFVSKEISLKKTLPYNFKQYTKELAILCTLSLSIALYNQTDTFILGFIDPSKVEVANYSVGIKGIDIIIGIIGALSTVFIPRAAFYYQKEDKRFFNNTNKYSINICLFIILPAIVTMAILAKPICSIISGTYDYSNSNNGYLNSPLILIVLSTVMLTYSISEIIYGQILLPQKKEKAYLVAILVGTIINIALSIVIGGILPKQIPTIKPSTGVAIGTLITDILVFAFLTIYSWKWTKNALFNKNSLKLIIANFVIAGTTFGFKYLFELICKKGNVPLVSTAVSVLIGTVVLDAIIYIFLLVIMKEDLVYSFIRNRKGKENV